MATLVPYKNTGPHLTGGFLNALMKRVFSWGPLWRHGKFRGNMFHLVTYAKSAPPIPLSPNSKSLESFNYILSTNF